MRKWYPEPLDSETVTSLPAEPGFAADIAAPVQDAGAAGFETDPSLARRHSLWDLMSDQERADLLEQARESLRPEYEAREKGILQDRQLELDEARAEFDARFDIWSREFMSGQTREVEYLASDAAGLAVALAGKIIRDTVNTDPGVVVRSIETALYKIQSSRPVTVVLNPDDADVLASDPELQARLRIGEIVSDRRIEKGGCRVRSGLREWDATISRQMDTLTAVVEEAMEEWSARPSGDSHSGQGDPDASDLG